MKHHPIHLLAVVAAISLSACSDIGTDTLPVAEALKACKSLIQKTSGGEPNDVKNYGEGTEFYFAWPSGNIPGGKAHVLDGLPMEASASCIGDLASREISSASVNSKDVPGTFPIKF